MEMQPLALMCLWELCARSQYTSPERWSVQIGTHSARWATLLEALYAAGGPTEIGSLRRVRIERGQTSLGEFDLYSYFVDGSASGDIRLENGDLVFVPPAESQVTFTGAVRREAIFEMLAGETASDLLKFAGGLRP